MESVRALLYQNWWPHCKVARWARTTLVRAVLVGGLEGPRIQAHHDSSASGEAGGPMWGAMQSTLQHKLRFSTNCVPGGLLPTC